MKLYNTNRKRLAEAIFASSSPADDAEVARKTHDGSESLHSGTMMVTITINEIMAALKQLPKKSSPGPDSVSVEALRSIPLKVLTVLLNLWLLHSVVPSSFKECITILIPKGPQANKPEDHRPITIGSVFCGLFSKIINHRLRPCVRLNDRQKGFMPTVDGCGENGLQSFGRQSFGRQVVWPTGRLADRSYGRQIVWPTGRLADW
ncbi:hypothetical protein M514_08449 [Trichuris suis]|uniref:Reverse transcriptase domain-containing protein n=1 Tax=Trichuris suis TaxID=68888 RepID=A0A085MTH3_9BILA|nr:hypothetical protein M514_08449 [Trichuris suis]